MKKNESSRSTTKLDKIRTSKKYSNNLTLSISATTLSLLYPEVTTTTTFATTTAMSTSSHSKTIPNAFNNFETSINKLCHSTMKFGLTQHTKTIRHSRSLQHRTSRSTQEKHFLVQIQLTRIVIFINNSSSSSTSHSNS